MGGINTGGLNAGMGEQGGGATVGEPLEGLVDLRLELGEASGVASDLLGPLLLLFCQRGLEILKGLLQRRDLRAGLVAKAELHANNLASSDLLDTSDRIAGSAFLGTTFGECAP